MISGPLIHGNLAVYFVESEPALDLLDEFLTLEEGLAGGVVRVSELESASVRELVIENTSVRPCFIQAGDLLRGGKQDRVIGVDFVVPAKSGRAPVPTFCVEHGRWQVGRSKFSTSPGTVASKELRLAVQSSRDQHAVWREVSAAKRAFVGTFGLSPSETTSLNEELGREPLRVRLKEAREKLAKELQDRPNAKGVVWAVNGDLSTADVYDDPCLFRKLAPRLIESATLEAMTAPATTRRPPSVLRVRSFTAPISEGTAHSEHLGRDLASVRFERLRRVRFSCRWRGRTVHEQTIRK